MLRFNLSEGKVSELEIIEIKRAWVFFSEIIKIMVDCRKNAI
jgi:hypothetical protein